MPLLIGSLIAVAFWLGQGGRTEIVGESRPTAKTVGLCALQADPAAYNHKMIDIRAVVSHGFEDFTLSDPGCERRSGIWLEYGGLVNSETEYCCGVKEGTVRGSALVVEGIATRLVDDALFRRFDASARGRSHVSFGAHLIGRSSPVRNSTRPKVTFGEATGTLIVAAF